MTSASLLQPPAINEQFRGLWVATVNNIDWPSAPGSPKSGQLAEIDAILDRAQRGGFNAIFFQVRPTADALFRSPIEPMSAFISGKQGLDPGYDPLAEWITRAHARGLELHAWFNPFRTRHPRSIGPDAPGHLNNTRPDLVRTHGPYKWADPGEPAARDHFLRVVSDVLSRYDIDGVHIDDYFYPYPPAGTTKAPDFDDLVSFTRYQRRGGALSRNDWRRSNTAALVRELYQLVKREDPSVLVTVSPFGIWRPGHPAGIKGMDAYELIFADSRRWLREGWVDALMPQLYWPIDKPEQSFTALLGWWDQQNLLARHLWPGLSLIRSGPAYPRWLEDEVPRQLNELSRHNASGLSMFSASVLRDQPLFARTLASGAFAEAAVVPDAPWLGLRAPTITGSIEPGHASDTLVVRASADPIRWLVMRQRASGQWTTQAVPGSERRFLLTSADQAVLVQGVFRAGVRTNRLAYARR